MARLTTTSYAILAQLALKPWSAYELAEQRVRYFQYMWPRAESGIYREVKRLAAIGLAAGEKEESGSRPRTVYSITPEGLAALREWLGSPVTRIAMEFEALLRVFMAPFGTKEQLMAVVEQVKAEADEMVEFADGIRHEYLRGAAPFQQHVHARVLTVDFLIHFLVTIQVWAERAISEIDTWDDTSPEGKVDRATGRMKSLDPRALRERLGS